MRLVSLWRRLWDRARPAPPTPPRPRLALESLEPREVPAALLALQSSGGGLSTLVPVDADTGRTAGPSVFLAAGGVRDLAATPAGELYGVRSGELLRLDPKTGATSAVLASPLLADASALAAAPDGSLYALAGGTLVRATPATGGVTRIGAFGYVQPPMWQMSGLSWEGDLAFAADGALYYVSAALFRVNLTTAALTQVGSTFTNGGLFPPVYTGLVADGARLIAIDSGGQLAAINSATGAHAPLLRSSTVSVYGASTVPEPAAPPALPAIPLPDLNDLRAVRDALFVTLVNEIRAPSGSRAYAAGAAEVWFERAAAELRTIAVALVNRYAVAPHLFPYLRRPAGSLMDVLRTPNTIQGMGASGAGVAVLAPSNRARIAEVFRIANDPAHPLRAANHRFLTLAADVARAVVGAAPGAVPFADPFAARGGSFAWFAADYPGRPLGAFVPVPVGTIGGTAFYTLRPFVPPAPVTGVQLLRSEAGVTGLTVPFSREMAASATDASRYAVTLTANGRGQPVRVASASYDPRTRTVTLTFARPVLLGINGSLRLALQPGLQDAEGYRLTGTTVFRLR